MSSQAEMVKIIKEWITIDNDIRNINKEIRIRKEKLKKISQSLMKTMKENEIDTVKVQDKVKVNFKTKTTKGSLTKDVIKKGLGTFFGGNEAQVEGAFQAILDAAPIKETDGVTVTGLKALLEA